MHDITVNAGVILHIKGRRCTQAACPEQNAEYLRCTFQFFLFYVNNSDVFKRIALTPVAVFSDDDRLIKLIGGDYT